MVQADPLEHAIAIQYAVIKNGDLGVLFVDKMTI